MTTAGAQTQSVSDAIAQWWTRLPVRLRESQVLFGPDLEVAEAWMEIPVDEGAVGPPSDGETGLPEQA